MSAPSISGIAPPKATRTTQLIASARLIRSYARLISGLTLLAFVLCHLGSHIFLIISVPVAQAAFGVLMAFWLTSTGTAVLTAAFLVHILNALWSIYIR